MEKKPSMTSNAQGENSSLHQKARETAEKPNLNPWKAKDPYGHKRQDGNPHDSLN